MIKLIIGLIALIIIILVIYLFIKSRYSEEEDSFLGMAVHNVSNGCAKLIKVLKRGC